MWDEQDKQAASSQSSCLAQQLPLHTWVVSTACVQAMCKQCASNACGVQEAFGTTDEEKICLEILAKGELQVGSPIFAACL